MRRFALSDSDLRESLVGRHAENFENLHSSTCISSGADDGGKIRKRERKRETQKNQKRERTVCDH